MDKWDDRFMQMAFTIAEWSSCFRKDCTAQQGDNQEKNSAAMNCRTDRDRTGPMAHRTGIARPDVFSASASRQPPSTTRRPLINTLSMPKGC